MRVVAGTVRGKRLKGPPTDAVRPTTDMVREAIFNALTSRYDIDGAEVLDLFAGTGAVGIEALSRGAAEVTFVDRNRKALEVVWDNLATTGFTASVVCSDALTFLNRVHSFDLAFIDPPYEFAGWNELLDALHSTVAICESDRPVDVPDSWRHVREGRYGGTVVSILERVSAGTPDHGDTRVVS